MDYKFAPAFISDIFTPFYDLIVEKGGLGKSLQIKILNYAQIRNGERILDIGCGTGSFVILAKINYPDSQVTGIDPDQNIINIAEIKAKKKNIQVDFIRAYAEKLPFNSWSFDLVVSSLTFHHLPTEIKKITLEEIKRVLKPNGRFILADIGKPDSLFWKIKFMLDLERIFMTGEYMKDNLEGKLQSLLLEAGFKVKEMLSRHQGVQFLIATKS